MFPDGQLRQYFLISARLRRQTQRRHAYNGSDAIPPRRDGPYIQRNLGVDPLGSLENVPQYLYVGQLWLSLCVPYNISVF